MTPNMGRMVLREKQVIKALELYIPTLPSLLACQPKPLPNVGSCQEIPFSS